MSSNLTWQQIPLLRMLLPLVLGGGIYIYYPFLSADSFFFTFLLTAIALLFLLRGKYWGFCFLLFATSLGYYHFSGHDTAFAPPPVEASEISGLHVLVVGEMKFDAGKDRWKGSCTLLQDSLEKNIKIYAWIENSSIIPEIIKGDTLIVSSKLSLPSPPDCPGDFDFRNYLQRKNIALITYVSTENVRLYKPSVQNSVFRVLGKWKAAQKQHLYQYSDSLSANLLSAILFGDADQLSNETREKFSEAGIAHILAVSGMHVGILIMIILGVVKFIMRPSKRRRWVQFVAILLFVWIYVCLCDFAASACRAAMMASFYYLGKSLNIKASALNALGASGLVLFFTDPFYLLDLGTQLSFAAMFGILLSYAQIETFFIKVLHCPNKLASLLAISFSAQLGVAPLIFYYFGSFPLLFWLFSIPAAYFAVFLFIGGWLLVLFQNLWSIAASVTGFLVTHMSTFFTDLISSEIIGPLPQINLNYFPPFYICMSFLLVTFILMAMQSQTKKQLFKHLVSILMVITVWNAHYSFQLKKLHIIEINKDDQRAICLIQHKKAYIITDKEIAGLDDIEQSLKQAFPVDSISQNVFPHFDPGTLMAKTSKKY